MNTIQKIAQSALVMALAGMLGACGNDLSDLNDLAKQSALNNSVDIEVRAELSDAQVVSSDMVSSELNAEAQFFLDLASNALEGQVNINTQPDTMVQQVQIRRGFGGQNGALLLDLVPDTVSVNVWRVPDNKVLNDAEVELMFRGGLYVLVTTSEYSTGEVRGQLLLGGQEILVNPLTAIQIISGSSDSTESATSYLFVDFYTGEVQGTVRHTQGLLVNQLAMHSGITGVDGDSILNYEMDPIEPFAWRIPDNTVLTAEELALLERAELYLQLASDSYPEGELRGQLHLSHYLLSHSNLSGMTLIPEISTAASGNAYVTMNLIDGSVRAIVRVSGLTPENVIMFRVNNPNNTSNGKLLYSLVMEQDYWRLPGEVILGNSDFNDINSGRLLFIVTSAEFPLGEIAGKI